MDSLLQWILEKINNSVINEGILLDVGAYHGDFTSALLESDKLHRSILFEPNSENLSVLRDKFNDNIRVDLIPMAISDCEGDVDFYCSDDLATGSVLCYENSNSDYITCKIKTTKVKQITLDSYLFEHPLDRPVSILKVDTQGADFKVLKGAERLLENDHPILVIELIFVNLYENQANPHELLAWLADRGYVLGSLFNEHYTDDGWLAFADGVFVPKHCLNHFKTPFHFKHDITSLKAENEMLHKVCEERLALINRLHDEASKRLDIINQLQRRSMRILR